MSFMSRRNLPSSASRNDPPSYLRRDLHQHFLLHHSSAREVDVGDAQLRRVLAERCPVIVRILA